MPAGEDGSCVRTEGSAIGSLASMRGVAVLAGTALGLTLAGLLATAPVAAQNRSAPSAPSAPSGNMICWYDKSGRQLGCGYTVPPEYANYEIRELNRRGVTVKRVEGELTPEQQRVRKEEDARRREAEDARAAQRKRDATLLASFSSEKEIEARRERDLAQVEVMLSGLQGELNQLRANEADVRRRIDAAAKSGKPVPTSLRDDYLKATADVASMEKAIAERRAEQITIRTRYDEMRNRYLELSRKP